MRKLLTTFACLLCFVLNASMVGVSPIKNQSSLLSKILIEQEVLTSKQNSTPHFAKGFRPPRGVSPKPAPKPKGQPPKQQPKSGGKDSPKGSHDKNQRESNREKHENADARRQKEQKKAEEKKERNKKNK